MRYIRIKDDEDSSEIIKSLIKNFDSYEYIHDKLDVIFKTIKNDIECICYDDKDKIYNKIYIHLYNNFYYAFDYDNKNYPILSFNCRMITIYSHDTIIGFDDNLQINLFELDFKTFDKIN